MKIISGVIAVCVTLLMMACSDDRSIHQGKTIRPNVVLISIDTLRADHLGSYGHGLPVSPVLDRIAQQGVMFRDVAVQGPYTLPSHSSMLTGTLVNTHGVRAPHHILPKKIKLISEILHDNGFYTLAVTAGGYVSPTFHFSRGFDIFESPGQKFETSVPVAIQRLKAKNSDQPFFLFLHGFDVHLPYTPPELYSNIFQGQYPNLTLDRQAIPNDAYQEGRVGLEYYLAQYDAELRHADHQLEALFHYLEDSGAAENTICIITSDHGEELMDHGAFSHRFMSMFNSNISVPLILAGPGIPQGQIMDGSVQSIDIVPWLLDVLKIVQPDYIDGVNLMEASHSRRSHPLFSELFWFKHLKYRTVKEVFNGFVCPRAGIIESVDPKLSITESLALEYQGQSDILFPQENGLVFVDVGSYHFQLQFCDESDTRAGILTLEFIGKRDEDFENLIYSGQGCASNNPESPAPDLRRIEQDGFVWYLPEWYPLERFYTGRSVQLGDWKLILDRFAGVELLFNMAEDPQELKNYAREKPEIVAKLKLILDARFSGGAIQTNSGTRKFDKMDSKTVDQLRELGYLADE